MYNYKDNLKSFEPQHEDSITKQFWYHSDYS